MPAMPLGDLSQAWVAASAALPLDWLLVGVWLDPDNPSEWQAVARGPGEPPEIVTGHGSHRAGAQRPGRQAAAHPGFDDGLT